MYICIYYIYIYTHRNAVEMIMTIQTLSPKTLDPKILKP